MPNESRVTAGRAMFVLAGITLIALALRLPSLGDSLFADELSTHFIVHGFGAGGMLDLIRSNSEVSPPLFFMLADLSEALGGREALRLPSLLAGLASIPMIYLLGLRTVGEAPATLAALLLALSPFQIFYATEARGYAVAVLLCMLAALALLQATESGRAGWWGAFALAAAAAVYTHYSAIFFMLALFIWALFARPRTRRPLLIASAAAVLLFTPWLGEYARDAEAPNGAKLVASLNPLTTEAVRRDLGRLAVGHPFIPASEVPGNLAVGLIACGLLLAAVGVALRARGQPAGWRPSPGLLLAISIALAAPLGALLYALLSDNSVFSPRYLIVSSPGLVLVISALAAAGRGPIRGLSVALVVCGFAVGAVKMLSTDNQRPDFVGAAEFIEERSGSGAPVVEIPVATPGPTTNLETAFADSGRALPEDRAILVLGTPTFEDRLDARRTDGPEGVDGVQVLDPLPIPDASSTAKQAVKEAGAGPLFLVGPDVPLEDLRAFPTINGFIDALPPQYREVEYRSFDALGAPLRVTVFEREPTPPGP